MSNLEEKHNEITAEKDEILGHGSPGFSELEETSPDLLKNTPSNIARLEDVIEHCKNRYKYLTQTRSPSDGEDIRWYFCKVPLLAASVPRTEIVGKGDYFRFSMRDSLALEASFLQREEELLSYWWKEYAECSEGPKFSLITSEATLDAQSDELFAVDEERVGVPVKGGLYEVDLVKRHCFPVYWNGENRRVLRGHWYARKGSLDWLPLREDIAEQLEIAYHRQVWHRRTFQPSGLFAARIDIQGSNEGSHALFTGEDDTWEAWLVMDSSGFSSIGRGNSVRLRRGYSMSGSSKPTQDELRQQKEEEMDDYCSQVPVGHLVFMIHGIGQRLEKANLVDDVGDFRHITASLAETHLSPYQRSMQRVLFIPCQWRRGLQLSGESAVEKITLDGVRGLRETLSATVHDVLYYMSPIFCQDIINSVSNQLNRLYNKFLKRNPGYNGKVSIYGHSLGSVLSFDILCHQECFQTTSSGCVYTGTAKNIGFQSDTSYQNIGFCPAVVSNNDKTVEDVEVLENVFSTDKNTPVPHLNESVREETSTTQFLASDSSLTSDVTEVLSKKCLQNSCQGFEECLQLPCVDKPLQNVTIGDLEGSHMGVTYSDKSVDAKETDQHVSSLKEEVRSLKVKLAAVELKQKSICSTSIDGSLFPNYLSPAKDNLWTTYTPYIKYTKLDFKVDTFFAVGSPLGVFLALRNIRIGIGRGKEYWHDEKISEGMPSCEQMLNIFHPYDPVAYRFVLFSFHSLVYFFSSPLICKEYIDKRPVLIPYHRGGKRLHIGFQEFAEDISVRSQAVVSQLNSVKVKMATIFRSGNKDSNEGLVEETQANERSYGSIMMERLARGEGGRIDHMLQEKTFEHPYISALGAHTNYWRDLDTALFILKHLYRDIPEDPEATDRREESSKQGRQAVATFFKNEVMDEDIPLTFSNEAMVKEFSRKARKSAQKPDD
ncbi:unnamed protein product [Spirodela intermedia]|uniref:DDHD domain-containing protein n=1 Tax=Spirodela intermedia TaxID=51605 RepID=A0A7I8LCD9_SPIIN|nr:unnamed protein product [Spirodela intermedia]